MDHATKRGCDMSLLQKNNDLKLLILKCLTLEYQKRPSSKDIFNDKFFNGHITTVKKTAAIKHFHMSPDVIDKANLKPKGNTNMPEQGRMNGAMNRNVIQSRNKNIRGTANGMRMS